jgi:hypothetical protein
MPLSVSQIHLGKVSFTHFDFLTHAAPRCFFVLGENTLDRQIVYGSAIPLDTDLLSMNKNAMVGLGYSLLDALSAVTFVSGLPCSQTATPSLAVLLGAGRIYSLQNVDNTAYGSLAADTAHQIVKQGIQFGNVTLATAAPTTSGQSINYLIQAAYQDGDAVNAVLPFYNSANPSVPFSGQGNSGAPLPTQRQGLLTVTAKPGIPATTGSQTTPAPDSGFVGLYVVTVANGQSTVTNSNISVFGGAPFNQGTFVGTLTGCTTAPTVTIKWAKNGNRITAIIPGISGTSNSTACSITGMPPNLWPITTQTFGIGALLNNSSGSSCGGIDIDTGGVINLFVNSSSTAFTASGTKGISSNACVTWLIGE